MQHAIGDHALLADSRTAALVDPDGNVAWCCWPRVDATPLLMSILDDERGGSFTVRPAAEAVVESRAYHAGSLVLRTVWRVARARLVVDDALLLGEDLCLARVLRAEGGDVDVRAVFAPARRAEDGERTMRASGTSLWIDGSDAEVTAPRAWVLDARKPAARCAFTVGAGQPCVVAVQRAHGARPLDGGAALAATLAAWSRRLDGVGGVALLPDAWHAIGEVEARRLLHVSAAVLCGLQQRTGAIVAAPTTSLPQWPGSARCWDYRYCWLRDAALAGLAMLRLGLVDEAVSLGEFLGAAVQEGGVRPVLRVDGAAPPAETQPNGIRGYRGAHPVRFGNAAAEQLQLDVAGEVVELAAALAAVDALPRELAAATTLLASWTVHTWQEPDHGIWEIRGRPRHYTHSRVMAWLALRDAAGLAERGRVRGDVTGWRAAAGAIRGTVLDGHRGPLQLHAEGGGADAALSVVAGNGFLEPGDPRRDATLDLIAARLDHGGLLDRHEGRPDTLADRCAPFVFPSFWMAAAERAAGRDAAGRLRAATATAGALGLFGEVVDPATGGPLGNYPQVQSHASFVLAVTAPS